MASKCVDCGEFGVYFGRLCAGCLQKAHDEYIEKLGKRKHVRR